MKTLVPFTSNKVSMNKGTRKISSNEERSNLKSVGFGEIIGY